MATPSSSQTTPSPSLSFIQSGLTPPSTLDSVDSEERKRTVDKFLARAQLSQLTHALRARLSYASYKAQHNLTHIPLTQLEKQLAAQQPRRAQHPSGTPGNILVPHASAGTKRRAASGAATTGSMPPPPVPSLYTSLLAPPPAKRARPSPSTKARGSPTRSPRSSKQASLGSGTGKHNQPQRLNPQQIIKLIPSTPTEREDMNAAATLTSLLLNSRNSPRTEVSSGLSRTSSTVSTASFGSFLSQPQSSSATTGPHRSTTPKPDDNDAAQFLLYLSTSPSPARPTVVREPGALPSTHSHVGRILFASPPAASGINPSDAASGAHKRMTPPSQLLPPPPSPRSMTTHENSNSVPGNRTPKPAFNLSDFVNVSPSPSAPSNNNKTGTYRSGVPGRRLFDDDGQVISASASPLGFGMNTGLPLSGVQRRARFAEEAVGKGPSSAGPGTPTPLAAGIDLVRAASS